MFDRKQTLDWFLCCRGVNILNCKNCGKEDYYLCGRFEYIKKQLDQNHYFEAANSIRQPILWRIYDNYNLKPNRLNLNKYTFCIKIHRTVKSDFLIKQLNFEEHEIEKTC